MVGVDSSKYAEAALETGISFAKSFGSELVIVSVYAIPKYPSGRVRPIGTEEQIDPDVQKALLDMLKGYETKAKKEGVNNVETLLIESVEAVGPALVKKAEALGCDAILLGSRGLTGIKRTLLGSVADYVTEYAHCDTIIVRR